MLRRGPWRREKAPVIDDSGFLIQRTGSRPLVKREGPWLRSPIIHYDYIHGFPCHYCHAAPGKGRICWCHLRWDTDGAERVKPSDFWTWPGCWKCHDIQGLMSELRFHQDRGTPDPNHMVLTHYGMTSPDLTIAAGARAEFERRYAA